MATFTPVQVLQTVLVLQSLLLATFLFYRRVAWPLALFLLVLALHMGWNMALAQRLALPDLRAGFAFAYGPLMLALVRHFAWRDRPALPLLHALPAVAAALTLPLLPDLLVSIWPFVALSAFGYLWAAGRELRRFHAALRASRSSFEAQNLHWLQNALWLVLGLAAVDGLRMLLRPLWPPLDPWLAAATYAGALGFVSFLVWRGLQQPGLFARLDASDREAVVPETRAAPGLASEPSPELAPELSPELGAQQRQHLDTAKPWLDPELTVQTLARQLGWPAKQVSAVINQQMGRNFNDLINAERVAEACRLLADPARAGDKLLAIQLDAGFASKSVFNAAFKRETGQTPSAWRAAQG